LPTEGEWEYAARAGKNENKYPWATNDLQSSKGCFLGNFKPGNGNYTEDGHLITSKVGSYSPNEFGLYDMAGNVAEWTSTTYSESGPNQMNDMNPDLRYNAAKEDPYAMKQKVCAAAPGRMYPSLSARICVPWNTRMKHVRISASDAYDSDRIFKGVKNRK
jgi:formylglycine-generating enzyme required for sulfatase activity